MLVTFTSPAYADITMFGDIAINLLQLMGHSGQVPSALLADDIPQALQKLQAAIERDKLESEQEAFNPEDDEPVITLSKRALPLLELLKASAAAKCNVMWDHN